MSSRQLRKLRKQQELLTSHKDSADGSDSAPDDDDAPISRPTSKPQFSGFAALAGGDDDDDDDEPEPEAQEDNNADATEEAVEEPAVVKKSKKSKKKKKKGKKAETPAESGKAAGGDGDLDEIDRAIKELKLAPTRELVTAAAGSQTPVKTSERLSQLLSINLQHLKVLNEMRRLFGKEAIESAAAEEDARVAERVHELRRRGNGEGVDLETFLGMQGLKDGMSEVVARRNPFIEGKKRWPKGSAGGLTMTTIGPVNGDATEFSFAHDKAYGDLEATFFFLIGMHDPSKLILFLSEHPYHVSTLIQVSKVAIQQDQNASLAAELCERALFTFGRVTLSTFRKKLEEGQARLNFNRPENRQFWLAGHNYIKNLIRKGTFRTALEWTKLFVSIAPEDPYGMANWLHSMAVRAHESQWFIDLCDSELLSGASPKIGNASYLRQTLVLAKLQRGDRTSARTLLAQGMAELPWLYSTLFKTLNLDVPKSLWAIFPRDDDEQLYTELYIHTMKDLWNKVETTTLMVEVAKALSRPNIDSLPPGPKVSLGTARFVYLEDTPALMSHVPRNMLHVTPNFDFDPLPPPKEENIFSNDRQRMPWDNDVAEGARDDMAAQLPAMIEAQMNHPDMPEDRRGFLRQILDMIQAAGGMPGMMGDLGGGMAEMMTELGGALPGMMGGVPGEWEDEFDDEDEEDEFDEDYEYDMDRWGYPQHEVDENEDGDESDDEMPPLIPINDDGNRTGGDMPGLVPVNRPGHQGEGNAQGPPPEPDLTQTTPGAWPWPGEDLD